MLFDKLCGLSERHFPILSKILHDIALFHFADTPHIFLNKVKNEVNYKDANELFQLPFSEVAIEDNASVTLLMDTSKNQIGLDSERKFVDMFCIDDTPVTQTNERKEWVDDINMARRELYRLYGTIYSISFGSIYYLQYNEDDGRLKCNGMVDEIYLLNKKSIIDHRSFRSTDKVYEEVQETLKNPITAYEEIIALSNPRYFVLEETPENKSKKTNNKKIPRSNQRPIFTCLDPSNIRQKLNLKNPEGQKRNSPAPHERRRHLRKLRKESGYKEDKIISVKATWIGTSEKKVGNKKYRVRLDI